MPLFLAVRTRAGPEGYVPGAPVVLDAQARHGRGFVKHFRLDVGVRGGEQLRVRDGKVVKGQDRAVREVREPGSRLFVAFDVHAHSPAGLGRLLRRDPLALRAVHRVEGHLQLGNKSEPIDIKGGEEAVHLFVVYASLCHVVSQLLHSMEDSSLMVEVRDLEDPCFADVIVLQLKQHCAVDAAFREVGSVRRELEVELDPVQDVCNCPLANVSSSAVQSGDLCVHVCCRAARAATLHRLAQGEELVGARPLHAHVPVYQVDGKVSEVGQELSRLAIRGWKIAARGRCDHEALKVPLAFADGFEDCRSRGTHAQARVRCALDVASSEHAASIGSHARADAEPLPGLPSGVALPHGRFYHLFEHRATTVARCLQARVRFAVRFLCSRRERGPLLRYERPGRFNELLPNATHRAACCPPVRVPPFRRALPGRFLGGPRSGRRWQDELS